MSPSQRLPEPEQLAFIPATKVALDGALAESRELGLNDVGDEHLLLGLAREGESLPAILLQQEAHVGLDLLSGTIARILASEEL